MKRIALATMVVIVAYAAVQLGCMDREPAPVCPVPTELKADNMKPGGFDGVDLLVMVDNSGSMNQEQAILATSFFPLVNSLANPLPGWSYPPAEALRLAVITSNMGFSSDGVENDEFWPEPVSESCAGKGDNGKFQDIGVGSVTIQSNVIPCDVSAAQCPAGWTCEGIDAETGVGVCTSASTSVSCPDLSMAWAETSEDDPNASFAIQAACLADQGTGGCGFEQQLASVAKALTREDQEAFLVSSHLLTILIVSDEEDCSMKDGEGLFAQPEVADDFNKWNVACGENGDPEDGFLFAPGDFYQTFIDKKKVGGVVFAVIAGVPYGTQDGAEECQGPGDELGDCLDQAAMQLDMEQPSGTTWYYHPACTRSVDSVEVTKAYPGRRYVELAANNFGEMSYVYSICNEDWSPAMADIARIIAEQMAGTCYEKPLDWDPALKVAKCNVVLEYVDEGEECPDIFGDDAEPIVKKETDDDGEERVYMYCPIPKIPYEQDCNDLDQVEISEDEFGWYYCENLTDENFSEACSDGLDNDSDGQADCDDDECADCMPCPDATGNDCSQTCKYKVELTEAAKSAVGGRVVAVQCLQQFSFEDRNCQEDSRAACTDSIDNDGNGIWDCSFEAEGSTDQSGEKGHNADPNCCPMVKDGDVCDLEPEGVTQFFEDICPESEVDYNNGYPDACWEAASRLGCTLP
ncbi:MAG: hypothetical protein M0R80_06290 [Proteobacteria bacterium]|jgi:hypothetical protein|nr:hypothetical protein [Pseudomonadota bacterium]